jgi:hypothetical protein
MLVQTVAKRIYHFVFEQKELPKWIILLNNVSLSGILCWPVMIFGSIFLFDDHSYAGNMYILAILLATYPFLLILITFISYAIFKLSKTISAIFPLAVIGFYLLIIIRFLFPATRLIPGYNIL